MEIMFEVKDKTGRIIYLTRERYKHITSLHPDMVGRLEDIKQALTKPTLIVPHKYDNNMRNYYLYYKDKKRYLLVSVKI